MAAGHCEGTADAAVKRSPTIDACLNRRHHAPAEYEDSPDADRDQAAEEEPKPPAAHTPTIKVERNLARSTDKHEVGQNCRACVPGAARLGCVLFIRIATG